MESSLSRPYSKKTNSRIRDVYRVQVCEVCMASIEKAREIRSRKEFVSARKAWEVLSALGKPRNVSNAQSRKEAANELHRMAYEKDVAVYIYYVVNGRRKVSRAKDEPTDQNKELNIAPLDGTNELDNLFANLSFIGKSDEGSMMGAYAPDAMERLGFDPLELSARLGRNLGYDESRIYKKLTGLTHPEHDDKTRTNRNSRQKNDRQESHIKDALSSREKTALLNIIGALVSLMLDNTPSGQKISVYDSQAAIISGLLGYFPNVYGISERTLEEKFVQAKRNLKQS